jgi:hypothetical protein
MREEREMIELFGARYLEYKKSVPALFPRVWAKKGGALTLDLILDREK